MAVAIDDRVTTPSVVAAPCEIRQATYSPRTRVVSSNSSSTVNFRGMTFCWNASAPANMEERLLAIALAAERVLGSAADRLGTPPLLAS